MPVLREMYPSKYLHAEDLTPGKNTIVTIRRVYPAQARSRGDGEDAEVKWMIRFDEYRKPMGLWRTTAKLIADLLGSDNTDHWTGKRIAIFPGTYTSFGEVKPCINVDRLLPGDIPEPAAKTTGLVIKNDLRPVPKAAMDRFLKHLAEQGKSWDDYLRWCKGHAPEALPLAFGVALDEIPCGVLPAMKAYLDSLTTPSAGSLPQQPQQTEVVDKRTGEVVNRPQSLNGPSTDPIPVPDDDIPF